jgi:hypothetical protein
MRIAPSQCATALLLLALSLACASAQSTSASAKCTAGKHPLGPGSSTGTLSTASCSQFEISNSHAPAFSKLLWLHTAALVSSTAAFGHCMSRVTGCQPAVLLSCLIAPVP